MGAWAQQAEGERESGGAGPPEPDVQDAASPAGAIPATAASWAWGTPRSASSAAKTTGLKSDNMVLQGVTLDRLQDRDSLRASLDHFRRQADTTGAMDGLDAVLAEGDGHSHLVASWPTPSIFRRKTRKVVAKYGVDDPAFERDGAPRMVRNFCIARRLVEAGARVVSMNFIRWDWHGGDGMNFVNSQARFPAARCGPVVAAAGPARARAWTATCRSSSGASSAARRGSTSSNSRDHWPQANAAIIAGGGMQLGQVIGATNKYGEHPADRPVKFQEVFATLYAKAGLNSQHPRVRSPRPAPIPRRSRRASRCGN